MSFGVNSGAERSLGHDRPGRSCPTAGWPGPCSVRSVASACCICALIGLLQNPAMLMLESLPLWKDAHDSSTLQEVRRGRVVLVPGRQRDLHLVLRVLDVGELDVRRDRLERGLVADLREQALQVLTDRLVDVVVLGDDGDGLPGRAGLLHQLLGLGDVRRGPGRAAALGVLARIDVSGEARRQERADRLGQVRPAVEAYRCGAVDGPVDGLAGLEVVERREVGVHREVVHRRQRVHVRLATRTSCRSRSAGRRAAGRTPSRPGRSRPR